MPRDPKYYVRRDEWWGGRWVWFVYDRKTRKIASSKKFESERSAVALCKRMNEDWVRYEQAMWEKQS